MTLTAEELRIIKEALGREPTEAELAIFTSHWSEHCSYKSTREWLKRLPTRAPWVARGPGTDAPLVEIAPGLYATFKIESHNHPSAVDPYNGAATGVGGIIRDILTVGAKPVALLVNLHFGPPEHPHAAWIAANVVRGISDYGNRVGVPVVGGETWFDPDFAYTPIVLATCVGIVEEDKVPKGGVEPGDLIVVAGLGTDRSGLGGSAFASKTLKKEEEEVDLGAVQVADPLMGKKLIDVVQEAKCVKFIKDLGGGGLATALAELSEWFNLGVEADLDKLHRSDPEMTPPDVLASETQERMVFIVSPKDLECLVKILEKYEVPYSTIGKFAHSGAIRLRRGGQIVAEVPTWLAAKAPALTWPVEPYDSPPLPEVPEPPLDKALDTVLSSPNAASREAIYTRFDFDVGVRTVVKPGEGDAAVLKIYERGNLGLVVKSDANPRYAWLAPRLGAANAFVKAYRNVAVAGGVPKAAVDSLNLGSPARRNVYWQFREMVEGVREAAESLGVPVVGGKVSLYNEYNDKPIKPVATVVVLGVIDDVSYANRALWRDGDGVYIYGVTRDEVGGSEYLYRAHRVVAGKPPSIDFDAEKAVVRVVQQWRGKWTGAKDVGLGGLAAALAKMALSSGVGAEVDVCKAPYAGPFRLDYLLFSESNGRFVAAGQEAPGTKIGAAGGDRLVFKCGSTTLYRKSLGELAELMKL